MDVDALTSSGILGERRQVGRPQNDLGQEDFLRLMVAQLQNQDPFNPMENGEFLAQIAQFTTATGVNELQAAFNRFQETMAGDQSLRAAALVDRTVVVESRVGRLNEDAPLSGSVDLPRSVDNMKVQIFTPSGELVREMALGPQSSGNVSFEWDGIDRNGKTVPPGQYEVRATTEFMGETIELRTLMSARVDSVQLSSDGRSPTLDLEGIGSVRLSDVRQIM